MHPIERLRYVARASGGDQRMLVRETAGALRGLGFDPAGLVVACRRIVERHPTSGPLWWLCASVLAAADPYRCAAGVGRRARGRPDARRARRRAARRTRPSCVVGWPDLIGEALMRRGDFDGAGGRHRRRGHGQRRFVRRLQRADVDAEIVPAAGLAAAVLASDLVVVEAMAVGDDRGAGQRRDRAPRRRSATAPRCRCGLSSVAAGACRRRCSKRWVERLARRARRRGTRRPRSCRSRSCQLGRPTPTASCRPATPRCSRSARCRTSCSAPARCDDPKYCRAMASKRSQIMMTDDEVQAYLESERRSSTSPRSGRAGIRTSWRCGTR